MKPAIFFTTETQRAQSNDPSAPPTALAPPACGWSRVDKVNPSVVGLSMLQSFRLFFVCSVPVLRSLGVAGCFVVSLLVLIPALHAQTNTFPSSGSVGIGTTNPGATLDIRAPNGTTPFNVQGASSNAFFQLGSEQALFLDAETFSPATAANPTQNSPRLFLRGNYWNGSSYSLVDANIGNVVTGSGQYFMSFRTNNTDRMVISQSGNVGIGTITPLDKLAIYGSGYAYETIQTSSTNVQAGYKAYNDSQNAAVLLDIGSTAIGSMWAGVPLNNLARLTGALSTSGMWVGTAGGGGPLYLGTNQGTRVTIDTSGNVGIGTTSPGYPLTVNGAVRAKEVIVDTGWSDYVFDDGYKLASLSEVEAKIKSEHHLPGIPSAKEVAEKGISVGEAQAKLLQKVEELTLYMIDLKKENEALKAKSATLEVRLEAIETKSP